MIERIDKAKAEAAAREQVVDHNRLLPQQADQLAAAYLTWDDMAKRLLTALQESQCREPDARVVPAAQHDEWLTRHRSAEEAHKTASDLAEALKQAALAAAPRRFDGLR